MSAVTGVALFVGSLDYFERDDGCVGRVRAWLADRGRGELVDVADHAGGRKRPQFELHTMGVNGFHDEDEFARFVLSLDWKDPGNVVLVLQPEEGWTRVFRPVSNEMLKSGDQIDANTLYDADEARELLDDAADALKWEGIEPDLRKRIGAFLARYAVGAAK